jgi:dTDP-4-amino-4,6-dideoxygalactose transaminase
MFYKQLLFGDSKYYDKIHPLIEKKYLKTIYDCHECAGSLENQPE